MTEYTDSKGVRYIAKPEPFGAGLIACTGCAHEPSEGEPPTPGCASAPTCVSLDRASGQNIIWVRCEK